MLEHLSPSTVKQFRQCARKIYFKKILNIADSVQYARTTYGSAIHLALEQLFYTKIQGYTMPIKELQGIFEQKFQELKYQITIWGEDSEEWLLEQGKIALEDFYNTFYDAIDPLELESEIVIERPGGLPIKSIADVITKDAKIIDYKTGKGFSGSADEKEFITQLVTYALGYYIKYGVMPTATIIKEKWSYKKQPNGKRRYHHVAWEEVSLPIDESWFGPILETYDIVEDSIKKGVFLPAKDGDGLCKSCSYRLSGHCNVKGMFGGEENGF